MESKRTVLFLLSRKWWFPLEFGEFGLFALAKVVFNIEGGADAEL